MTEYEYGEYGEYDEYEVYDPAFYECACGEVEYECELCGYHGHDCPLEED